MANDPLVLTSPKRDEVHRALLGAGMGNMHARRIAKDFDTGWLGRCCGNFDGVRVATAKVRRRRVISIRKPEAPCTPP